MKRYGVRLSVCPSVGLQQQTCCCRFADVGPAVRKYSSVAAAVACDRQMRVVPGFEHM